MKHRKIIIYLIIIAVAVSCLLAIINGYGIIPIDYKWIIFPVLLMATFLLTVRLLEN